jgi:hypothetical protein
LSSISHVFVLALFHIFVAVTNPVPRDGSLFITRRS